MVKFELAIGGLLKNIDVACEWLRSLTPVQCLKTEEQFQLELCLVEVITNIISHAYGDTGKGYVNIICLSEKSTLKFKIADSGRPMLSMPKGELPRSYSQSGRGWYIILKLMDKVEYYRRRTTNVTILTKVLNDQM